MHALNFLWSLRHIWCVLDSGKAIDPCFFLLKHQYLYNPDKDRPLAWCLCMGLSLSCCEIPSWMSPTAPGSWGVCFAAVSGCLSPGSVLWVIPGSCGSSPALWWGAHQWPWLSCACCYFLDMDTFVVDNIPPASPVAEYEVCVQAGFYLHHISICLQNPAAKAQL